VTLLQQPTSSLLAFDNSFQLTAAAVVVCGMVALPTRAVAHGLMEKHPWCIPTQEPQRMDLCTSVVPVVAVAELTHSNSVGNDTQEIAVLVVVAECIRSVD